MHISHVFNLRNMVFEILPKLTYDAMKELRREKKAREEAERQKDQHRENNVMDPSEIMAQQLKMATI